LDSNSFRLAALPMMSSVLGVHVVAVAAVANTRSRSAFAAIASIGL
jgi:hypothetical protein